MTDTLTSAGNVTGFLQVLFETATGPPGRILKESAWLLSHTNSWLVNIINCVVFIWLILG